MHCKECRYLSDESPDAKRPENHPCLKHTTTTEIEMRTADSDCCSDIEARQANLV